MKDDLKAKLFFDLQHSEAFKAQIAVEDETIEALQSKLLSIDPKTTDVKFEYARVRGSIEALKGLKALRERFIEDARSRLRNS